MFAQCIPLDGKARHSNQAHYDQNLFQFARSRADSVGNHGSCVIEVAQSAVRQPDIEESEKLAVRNCFPSADRFEIHGGTH